MLWQDGRKATSYRSSFNLAFNLPLESLPGPTSKALSPNMKKQRVEGGGKLRVTAED